ncbi:MAG: bifunctional nuclease domain-containing protein [Chitinophagales bacterium]
MKKIELEIVALSQSINQSQSYAVVLGETEGNRRLPIVIGPFEAQAIAVVTNGMTLTRPLTHDLMKNLCVDFDIELREVVINNLLNGIFHARLICHRNGEILEIDSRTSDALALAVRFGCSIYTYEFILDQAGIILENQEEEKIHGGKSRSRKKESNPNDLSEHSKEKLDTLLAEAIQKEDYERAAKLRDEIEKRS